MKQGIVREAKQFTVAKAMDLNPQWKLVLLVCSKSATSSSRLPNEKQSEYRSQSHKGSNHALILWLGPKRNKCTTLSQGEGWALGTGSDMFPSFPPRGQRAVSH